MKLNTFIILSFCFLCTITTALGQTEAPDPTKLAVGGRILGLGSAFIGLSDDVGAIFTNPAGLSGLKQWEVTSMSGSFMDDFSYLNFSGAYPTKFGVFGLGFANSGIAGGYATKIKEGSSPDNPVYEPDFSQPAISYANNVLFFSYGSKLPPTFPWETGFGFNFKIINSGLSGDGIIDGGAHGNEIDLGLLAKPLPYLTVGSTIQNALPASLGGKITYASGHYETYPAVWRNGVAFKLDNYKVNLLFDLDYRLGQGETPLLSHLGAEWLPIEMVAIRAGIDQGSASDGSGKMSVVSNFTSGLGFSYGGFRFDFARHQFSGDSGSSNNFFSLTYFPAPVIKSPPQPSIETAKPVPALTKPAVKTGKQPAKKTKASPPKVIKRKPKK